MRRIAAELTNLAKRSFEPRDHIVERARETADFISGCGHIQSLGEIAAGDPLRRQGNGIHGAQGPAGKKPAAGQRNGQRERHGDQQHEQESIEGLVHRFHGGADLDDVKQIPAVDDRDRDQSQRRFLRILCRLKDRLTGKCRSNFLWLQRLRKRH